jgi:hypothetical protein
MCHTSINSRRNPNLVHQIIHQLCQRHIQEMWVQIFLEMVILEAVYAEKLGKFDPWRYTMVFAILTIVASGAALDKDTLATRELPMEFASNDRSHSSAVSFIKGFQPPKCVVLGMSIPWLLNLALIVENDVATSLPLLISVTAVMVSVLVGEKAIIAVIFSSRTSCLRR